MNGMATIASVDLCGENILSQANLLNGWICEVRG